MVYQIEDPVLRQEYQEKANKFKLMKRGFRIAALTTVLGVAFFSYPDISPTPEGYSQYTEARRASRILNHRLVNRGEDNLTFKYTTPEIKEYSEFEFPNEAKKDSLLVEAINSVNSNLGEMRNSYPEFGEYVKHTGKQLYDFIVNLALTGTASFGLWIVGGDMYRRKEEKYKDMLAREKPEPLIIK